MRFPCPKCCVDLCTLAPVCVKKQWWIFKWDQHFCQKCEVRLVLRTGPTTMGFADWCIPLFAIKRKRFGKGF